MERGATAGQERSWGRVRGPIEPSHEASEQGRPCRLTPLFARIVAYTTRTVMKLADHPTVQRLRLKTAPPVPLKKEPLDAGLLKQLVLDAGVDDVGFVELGRPALDDQR